MSSSFIDKDRKVIPRWRDAHAAVATGEFDSPISKGKPPNLAEPAFERRLSAWQHGPSTITAADLVTSGIALGRLDEITSAAEFLLKSDSVATPAARRLAKKALARTPAAAAVSEGDHGATVTELQDLNEVAVRSRVAHLRRAVHESPRNSFLWSDLARAYTILGQAEPAIRAMDIALAIAPQNRFVLRSASRLLVHVGDVERAHDVMRSAAAVRTDPWLLAAEISCAAVAGRTSRLVKTGRTLLGSGRWRNFETSELSSALGTLDLAAGDTRAARRLFSASLQDPNDNAVAQAEWVARRVSIVEVDPAVVETTRAYEAQAWRQYRTRDWRNTILSCRLWLMEEPFSSRPTQMASYLSLVALTDFREAERFARQGLLANPKDGTLLNNLTVALANQGRLGEAELVFSKIDDSAYEEIGGTLLATQGLLAFRRRNFDSGRGLYQRAIEVFAKDPDRRALAELHLAREEFVARTPRHGETLRQAIANASGAQRPEVGRFLEMLLLEISSAK